MFSIQVEERLFMTPCLLLKLIDESKAHISAIVTQVTLIYLFQTDLIFTIAKSVYYELTAATDGLYGGNTWGIFSWISNQVGLGYDFKLPF